MSDQDMTWQEVVRELARLLDDGHDEPWREFQVFSELDGGSWMTFGNLPVLLERAVQSHKRVRLKPRTVRVTTHSGETLELPEPWWDVPYEERYFFVTDKGEVSDRRFLPALTCSVHINTGNAFRTESDAKAWADAMPKIRGAS